MPNTRDVSSTAPPAPGWRVDPTGRRELRYWDGARWTEWVTEAGVVLDEAVANGTAAVAAAPHPDLEAAHPARLVEGARAASAAPSTSPTMLIADPSRRVPALAIAAGAAFALVSAALPWVRAGAAGTVASGFGPDRAALVLVALAMGGFAGLLARGWQPRLSSLGAVVTAALGAAVVLPDLAVVGAARGVVHSTLAAGSPIGLGLWCAFFGSGIAFVGGLLAAATGLPNATAPMEAVTQGALRRAGAPTPSVAGSTLPGVAAAGGTRPHGRPPLAALIGRVGPGHDDEPRGSIRLRTR